MRRCLPDLAVTSNCGQAGGGGWRVGKSFWLPGAEGGQPAALPASAWGTMSGLSWSPLLQAHHMPARPPKPDLRGRPRSQPGLLIKPASRDLRLGSCACHLTRDYADTPVAVLALPALHTGASRARVICGGGEAILRAPNSVPGQGRVIWAAGPSCEQGRLPRSGSTTALLMGAASAHSGQMGKLRQRQASGVRAPYLVTGFFSLCWSSSSHH